MKTLGKKEATEAIKETKATVMAGEKLKKAYKTLADTQENNNPEVVKQVLQQYRNAGLVK